MIVTLDHRLFAPGPPAAVRCLQFVFAAQMRQHVLVVDPPWDASDSTHPVQSWLNKQPTEVRETIEKELESGYDEAANMGSHVARIRVENIAASRWESGILAPDDALRTMHTPLWLALLSQSRSPKAHLSGYFPGVARARRLHATSDGSHRPSSKTSTERLCSAVSSGGNITVSGRPTSPERVRTSVASTPRRLSIIARAELSGLRATRARLTSVRPSTVAKVCRRNELSAR
jgi:hypothetical protein